MATILTFDVGWLVCGWGLIRNRQPAEAGEIRWISRAAKKKLRLHQMDEENEAARFLARALHTVYDEHKPIDAVIGEMPHGGSKSAQAMRAMSKASGVVLCAVELWDRPAEWVLPEEVKAITNKWKASKEDVAAAVRKAFPEASGLLAGASDHITDAFGAYLAGRDKPLIRLAEQR